VWTDWRSQPQQAAEIGRRALELISSHRGAVSATSEMLLPFLERSGSPK